MSRRPGTERGATDRLPGWVAHLALHQALRDGALVVAEDPLELPLTALAPASFFAAPGPVEHLGRAPGGATVLRRWPALAAGIGDACPVVVAGSTRGAEDLAGGVAAATGRAADLVWRIGDGGLDDAAANTPLAGFAATTGRGRGFAREAARCLDLIAGGAVDPLAALVEAAGPAGLLNEVSFPPGGGAVAWLDPLACLRGLDRPAALAVLMRGRIELSRWRPVSVRVPVLGARSPRIHLRLDRLRGAELPHCRGLDGTPRPGVRHCAGHGGDTLVLDFDGITRPVADIRLAGHRVVLAGIGIALPWATAGEDFPAADPLAGFDDPFRAGTPVAGG